MKRMAPALLAALLAVLPLPAATSKVDGSGTVHTVLTETFSQGNNSGGTVLVHVAQAPDGTESRQFIPGTDNFTLEKNPVLDIDPVSDTPVLVWAQVVNRATTLFVARHENGSWSMPRLLWADGALNLEPCLDVRKNLLHVVWRQEGQNPVHLRLSLNRDSLEPAFGPEELPIDRQGLAEPGSDSAAVDSPGLDLSYFAAVIPPQSPEQPGRIVTWGIRDEPVPVVYFQPFLLPTGIQNVKEINSEWLAGTFVTWFTSGPSFYYTSLTEDRWDELRVIDLSGGRTTAEALLMLKDLLQR